MRYAGVDFGSKRVGVALSDESATFAMPKVVIPMGKETFSTFAAFCKEHGISKVVMGESRDYQGKENVIMKKAREFADQITKELAIPVVFEPEFLTSAEAERIQGKIDTLDASAAALILKSYLDKHHGA